MLGALSARGSWHTKHPIMELDWAQWHVRKTLNSRTCVVVWPVSKHMEDISERIIKISVFFLNILNMVFLPGNSYLGICPWTVDMTVCTLMAVCSVETLVLSNLQIHVTKNGPCWPTSRRHSHWVGHKAFAVLLVSAPSQSVRLSAHSVFSQSGEVHLRWQRHIRAVWSLLRQSQLPR